MTRIFIRSIVMRSIMARSILAVAAAVLLCLPAAMAQTVTGAVNGTVTDPAGAVVSGAHVVAHNLDTGVETPTTTNNSGFYRIEFLPIGRYEVMIDATGFGTTKVPEFRLEVLQTASFNVKLTVGGSSTTVNVSEAAPILNTNDDTLAATFTANTISNFPLNGLDFSAVTLYTPGAVSTYGNTGTTVIERSTFNSDSVNVNGNRAQANNYTLEGIDMNESFNNLISYSPAPSALEEIKVITADSPADYGNVNGGGVVSILKTGTNRFHGSAYGYVQDYRVNANSWQNKNQTPIVPINPFSQNQFGGTFGGPIKRDKLFFFVDYLGSRYHKGGIGTASVFTQDMRNGDFSVLLAQSTPKQLYDTQNGNAPYLNNQGVPVINPVAAFLFANPTLYPLPNAAPTDGIVANNYQAPTRSFKANNQGDIKIEYDINPKDKLTGFYAMSTAYDGTTPVLAIGFNGPNLYPTKLFGANWVHTFSPSLVNSARIGFTRTVWTQNFSVDSTGQFGDSGDSKVGINFPNQSFAGYSGQSITGGITAGGNPVFGGGLIDNTYSYIDNLTWQRGRHYLSMGVQGLRYQNNYPTANNNGYLGSLGYSGLFTSIAADANSGYGGADFLLDRVNSVAATSASVNVGQRQWRVGGFINDDFKVLPKLTLNFGFRYEIDEPWVESNNKTGNVDETTGQVLYSHVVPAGAPPGSGLCSNRGCYNFSFHQAMPRVGFAYQASDKLVVRGGYGATSFFEGNSSNQRLTSITPFIVATNVNLTRNADNSLPTPLNAETAFTVPAATGGTYNVYPKNIQPAYVQEWNLTTEYALTRTLSLQAGYVGEQGQHIEDYGNLNQFLVPGDSTSAPFYNSPYIGVNSGDPTTQVGSNPLLVTESRAMSNYNALEVVLRQRQQNGLEYTVNYTYGKAMTNSLGNYSLNVAGYSGAFENYYNSAADYGPAGSDITHNLTFTSVYALPAGHGQKYFSGVNRALDEVIGGWKVSAVGLFYSGFPETMTTNVGNNTNSYGTQRANQYRHLKIHNRSVHNWFGDDPSATPCDSTGDNGVCAYGAPAPSTFGTSRNGSVRGPGFHNVDMSAFKDFHLFGEHSVGFRFDAFNAFNITSYGNPDTGINNTSFGEIAQQNSIRSSERHLQFSLHYSF